MNIDQKYSITQSNKLALLEMYIYKKNTIKKGLK